MSGQSNFSKLYHSILRSQWAILPEYAVNLFPHVRNLVTEHKFTFAGEQEASIKTTQAVLDIYDRNGNKMEWENDRDWPEDSVAVVEIIGTMIKYGNPWCWGADELARIITSLDADPRIKGIVLLIDSPGGAVDAIPVFLSVLNKRTKPVVTLCDLCASAGYYTATHTDHIMADNNISSHIGSIGVMVSFRDFSGYYEENGIKEHIINADQSEYKNRPFYKALKGDYAEIRKEVLNPLAIQFQQAVRDKMSELDEGVEGILNGRMFYANDALNNGLIHSIGDLSAAFEKVHELAPQYELRKSALDLF